MAPVLKICRFVMSLPLMLIVVTGCVQSDLHGQLSQESLGVGIVSGTLGEQQRVALCVGAPSSISVVGQVQAVEGAAYLVRNAQGQEVRIPHDENTRIDRPAHVGDRIQSWLDRHGRAVLIRNLDRAGQ